MAATYTNRALGSFVADTNSDLFIVPIDIDFTKKQKRTDTPLLKMIGRDPAPKVPTVKLPWGWGSPDADQDAVGSGGWNSSDTTLKVSDASKFQVGHTFLVESEELLVTAVNESTDFITVASRGDAGTSAASHSAGMTIFLMTPAIAENQATPLSPITQGEIDYNYFQQTEESIQLSHRANTIPTIETLSLSVKDRKGSLARQKMNETIPIQLENRILFGQRAIGTSSSPSRMGGLLNQSSYITTRNTSLSGPLTETNLMDNLQTVYNLVGGDKMGKTVMGHPLICRIISSFYNDTRRTSGSDTSINVTWTEIETWFGRMKVVPNYRFLKSSASGAVALDKLVVFNAEDLALVPLSGDSGWYMDPLIVDGWYDRIAIRGDFTLKAQLPDSRLLLGGFSTTTSDYPALS